MKGRFPIFGVILLGIGIWIGLKLPDLDLASGFLVHRSILTHGFIIPLAAFLLTPGQGAFTARGTTIGLGVGMAVHLCFDLFPRGWNGFALIHVPFYGRTSAIFSQIWIAVGVIVCLYLAFVLVRDGFEAIVVAFGLSAGFCICAAWEGSVWPEVLALASGMVIAIFAAYGIPHGDRIYGKSTET